MKLLSQAKRYGAKLTAITGTALITAQSYAAPDTELIAAVTPALQAAGDTSKAVYILAALALAVVIAVVWGISAMRSSKRG